MADPTCGVCGGFLNVTRPHVAYVRHVESHETPALTSSVTVHDVELGERRHVSCDIEGRPC